MFPCGGKFVSDEAQPEEPAPEGVFRIVGDRARRAGRFGAQRLCADGEAQLDVGFDLARVECAVEGAELDGVRGALGGEGRVEVEQVVAAVVVVLPGTHPPVGVCAAALPVPNPRKFVHGRGLAPVQFGEETLLDGAAPALSAFGRDAQSHGQQVFLGVDDVHQPPQALRGVLAEADVDVDAAGTVGLCARRPDGSDHRLHHLDVLVAAHWADHLRRGVGDRAVALDRPVPPVGYGHLPVVKVEADVPRRRAEVRGDGLGGTFPAYAGGFNLDTESLVFHGVCSFRLVASFSGGAFRPPRPA